MTTVPEALTVSVVPLRAPFPDVTLSTHVQPPPHEVGGHVIGSTVKLVSLVTVAVTLQPSWGIRILLLPCDELLIVNVVGELLV
jgi:hypothetical protein